MPAAALTALPALPAINPLEVADRLAATAPPSQLAEVNDGRRAAQFSAVRRLELSICDAFAGAGGMTLGAAWAGALPARALNHWPRACETFNTNIGGAVRVDLASTSPTADGAAARMLLAAPDHIGFQQAAGRPSTVDSGPLSPADAARFRSRCSPVSLLEMITSYGYRRLGRDGFQVVLVEQLTEFARWEMFGSWCRWIADCGYRVGFVTLDAAHLGAAARRERLWVVATPVDAASKSGRLRVCDAPDLDIRIRAVCPVHGLVPATQGWDGDRLTGRYRDGAYRWVCTAPCASGGACGAVCRPLEGAARDVVGLSTPGPTLTQRSRAGRPLGAKTVTRLQEGIHRFGGAPFILQSTHRDGDRVSSLDEPLPTITTRQELCLVTPDGSRASAASVRYLTPDELALAAGFPPGWQICGGSVRDRVRQIGHATHPESVRLLVGRAAATLPGAGR